ncbi:MAG: FG-GAP-like repeat-containing protein [Candidatus Omnitrophica bacterium]|nr:FG-GAP-like repeat-containing protein [Candidatus Omnitrophota bacterium]
MIRKLIITSVALSVAFGFSTFSFAQKVVSRQASFERNIVTKALPALPSKTPPSLSSSSVKKSGQLPAYSNGSKPTITFTDINAGLTGIQQGAVAWGDYDNDGWLDVLVTGLISYPPFFAISKIYHNNGNGTFTENINAGLVGVGWSSVAWGDYDNDGWLDILLSGGYYGSGNISNIYHNNGNGTFTGINAGLPGLSYGNAVWGDYDNDGWIDILMAGYLQNFGNTSRIYHNNGNGTFTDINAGLPGVQWSSVAWGDYDNDGWLDFLLIGDTYPSNPAGGYIAEVYHNNGSGTFTTINAGLTGNSSNSAAWGDYDNDGDLDLLLSGQVSSGPGISKVYQNNGNGTFTDINAGLLGIYLTGSAVWGDYDNDGRLDILVAGYSTSINTCKIYHNTGGTANTVPDAPAALTANVFGSSVALTWAKSVDSQTPSNGLSYNLYIGTSPTFINALSPMANLSNGWRRKPSKEAIVQGTTKIIDHLPIGNYRWGVQAIDTALSGSPFTKLANFSVTSNVVKYIVTGRVTNPSGQGMPNVRIKQGNTVLAVTDSDGIYYFAKSAAPAWSGTVKPFIPVIPAMSGYTCSPTNRSYTNLNTHKINQDFIVTTVSVIHHNSSTN